MREIELAIAHEAECHANAVSELNPYAEAEVMAQGNARIVYTGTISPVHGVYALGIDGPVEQCDMLEIERFFSRKERAAKFWVTPFTDPSLLLFLEKYKVSTTQEVHGGSAADLSCESPMGTNTPDPGEWSKNYDDQMHALIKLHQKNTRYYLNKKSSYTFFHSQIAITSKYEKNTFSLQCKDAKEFQSKFIIHLGPGPLPLLYKRDLYEII